MSDMTSRVGTPTDTLQNPFPGLRPFEFDESPLFFGRDGQSDQLIRKLAATRFLAVVGTSGSGKSSLVRAGLLPALRGGLMSGAGSRWLVAPMRPGFMPVHNLANALRDVRGQEPPNHGGSDPVFDALTRSSLGLVNYARDALAPGENLLVLVDQFEELFRLTPSREGDAYADWAAAFVKLLLEAAASRDVSVYVVMTMRSDFLGDCDRFRGLPEAVNEGQFLIPRMSRNQLREAVTGPASVCGASVAQRLVNMLLNDAGDLPEKLPVFQHALTRTWDFWAREGRPAGPIDVEHYRAVGGMQSALSMHADEALSSLEEAGRAAAEKIFKGLIDVSRGYGVTRRPRRLGELLELAGAGREDVIRVVETFRAEGLLTRSGDAADDDSVVDLAHESLLRNWDRLRRWASEEVESRRTYARLLDSARLYKEGAAALMRDPELSFALAWRERERPSPTWAGGGALDFAEAMAFVDASASARDAETREARRLESRSALRVRASVLSLTAALLITVGLSVYALRLRAAAEFEKGVAIRALQEAEVQKIKAEAQRIEADKANLKLQEAYNRLDDINARTRLQLEVERAVRAKGR